MTSCDATLDRLNWTDMGLQLDAEGHALLPGLLGAGMARSLVLQVTAPCAHRVALESSDLGRGELFYFGASLPAPLEAWRTALYRRLAVIANRWNKTLGVAHRYPEELEDFLSQDRLQAKNTQKTGQAHAQSYFLISKNLQFSDSNTQCKTLVLVLAVHCEEA